MKIKFLFYSLLFWAIYICVSCSSKDEEPYLYIQGIERELTISNEATKQSFQINSNVAWTISATDDWIHIDKLDGNNSELLVLSFDENENMRPRQSMITIRSKELSVSFNVIQSERKDIIIDKDHITSEWNGGIFSLYVNSNIDFSIVAEPNVDWLSFEKNQMDVIINIQENNNNEIRTTNLLFISDVVKKSVTVTQKEFVALTDIIVEKDYYELTKETHNTIHYTCFPEDASDKTIIWESSNPSIVSVDQDGNIVQIDNGNVTITLSNEKSGIKKMVNVSSKIMATRLELLKYSGTLSNLWLNYGCTFMPIISVTPKNAYKETPSVKIYNNNIVAYDGNTFICKNASGESWITIDYPISGVSASFTLNVEEYYASAKGVHFDKNKFTLGGNIYTYNRNQKVEINSVSLIDGNDKVLAHTAYSRDNITIYKNNNNIAYFETKELNSYDYGGTSPFEIQDIIASWHFKILFKLNTDSEYRTLDIPVDATSWGIATSIYDPFSGQQIGI